jgi:predicted Zn finger-like uncharacterized protein
MNVSCPQCKTIFRVDPRKVPAEGVRARCSVCGGVFEVTADNKEEVTAVAAARAAPAPPPAPAVGAPPPAAEPPPQPEPAPAPPQPAPAAPPPPPPTPEAKATPAADARPFGQPDPEARARRLARALISDVAAYHPERQEVRGAQEVMAGVCRSGGPRRCQEHPVLPRRAQRNPRQREEGVLRRTG